MFKTILSVSAIVLATTTVVWTQETSTQEALAWEAVKQSDASADVFAFIEQYPDGTFTKEAQALMIDLLWAEMAAASPVTDSETEKPTSQDVVAVTFSAPLTQADPEIVGKSLEELIQGSPLFPPIEGLPEAFWIAEDCSNCHEWQKANLCDQANTYLTEAGAENLTKQHPYGGTFKQNLRSWAIAGCE